MRITQVVPGGVWNLSPIHRLPSLKVLGGMNVLFVGGYGCSPRRDSYGERPACASGQWGRLFLASVLTFWNRARIITLNEPAQWRGGIDLRRASRTLSPRPVQPAELGARFIHLLSQTCGLRSQTTYPKPSAHTFGKRESGGCSPRRHPRPSPRREVPGHRNARSRSFGKTGNVETNHSTKRGKALWQTPTL